MAGRFSFVRGLSLSDYLTLANGIGGAGAVLAVLGYMANGQPPGWRWRSRCTRSAWLMDFLDGRVARARGKSSALARISIRWPTSCRSASRRRRSVRGRAARRLGRVPAAVPGACAIGRLARYNVTSSALADESGKVRYFEGFRHRQPDCRRRAGGVRATGHLARAAARRAPARAVRASPARARLPGRRLRHGQQAAAHPEAVTVGATTAGVRRCRRRRRRRARWSADRRPAWRRPARGSSAPASASARGRRGA